MSETTRIFLSSTGGDLDDWRDAVAAALGRRPGVEVIRMEDFVASGPPPIELCLEKVAEAGIFVGLIGFRYGSAIPGRVTSFTQAEYEEAVRLGRPCLMHVVPDGHALSTVDHGESDEVRARLSRLRARVLRANTAARPEAWENPDRLALHVMEGVQQELDRQRTASAPGFTAEKYEARLKGRLEQIAEQMAAEDAEERATLAAEKAELDRRLSDLDTAFAEAQGRIAELEALLERESNHLGEDRLARAEQALEDGDFDEADSLLAEIEADEDLAIKRAARAAFGRGQIAEERVRWGEAADHYAKAARLDPSYDKLINAGNLLWRAGRSTEAIRFEEELVALSKRTHGKQAAETATSLNNLAESYHALGRYDEAESLFRQAIGIDEAALGEGHPDYARDLNNLAGLLQDMGRLEEAAPLFAQALGIFRQALGDGHPTTRIVAANRAGFLRQHFPGDPAIAELEAVFGADIGREDG